MLISAVYLLTGHTLSRCPSRSERLRRSPIEIDKLKLTIRLTINTFGAYVPATDLYGLG
jgi:hypothetical protein